MEGGVLELIIPVVTGVVAAAAGYGLAVWRSPRVVYVPEDAAYIGPGHPHVFDQMKRDGWWRCACGKKAPDDKQPKMKVG